ncbi:GNAT family N-acetyltransferase [Cohnella sp. WQ 127256]|uniref:GNAT family N-acetyltransferase n=1 Tax=Cohnella sp. WQ 127256 TaxID=2938790 RepID=UPI002117D80F|nr:GNAT family protein [Cohnella sp. WQ 127256]
MSIEIVTPRLILKSIDESKVDQVLDYVLRNKVFLEEWEISRTSDYFTVEMQREMLVSDNFNIENGQLLKVWMYKINEPDRIIGTITLNNIVRGAFLSCHLGYRLDLEERNKGYVTEGLSQVIDFAFKQLQLHRIEANIMPRNAASIQVVEKLGFLNEGLARKYLKINGKWEDHFHMVLLNEGLE